MFFFAVKKFALTKVQLHFVISMIIKTLVFSFTPLFVCPPLTIKMLPVFSYASILPRRFFALFSLKLIQRILFFPFFLFPFLFLSSKKKKNKKNKERKKEKKQRKKR